MLYAYLGIMKVSDPEHIFQFDFKIPPNRHQKPHDSSWGGAETTG